MDLRRNIESYVERALQDALIGDVVEVDNLDERSADALRKIFNRYEPTKITVVDGRGKKPDHYLLHIIKRSI